MPDDEAERVPSTYEAHLAALGPSFPTDAHRLCTEVSLHDGLLRAVDRTENGLEVVFRIGQNSTGYFDARLSYEGVRLSPSDEQFLRSVIGRRRVELLYNEFDTSDSHWVHQFMFWPYREVSIQFRALTLALNPAKERFDNGHSAADIDEHSA